MIKEELNDIKDEIRELISADFGQTAHEQPRALGLRGLEGPPKWAKELDEQNLDEDRPDPFAGGTADPAPGEPDGLQETSVQEVSGDSGGPHRSRNC